MSSIGKDLVKIRKHLGYTIEDIQYATKIPVSTLRTIEDSSIFTKSDEGTTYIRSFIRSYGRALHIDDDLMIKALDQYEDGNYNHLLLQSFPSLTGEENIQTRPADEAETEEKPVTPPGGYTSEPDEVRSKDPMPAEEDLFGKGQNVESGSEEDSDAREPIQPDQDKKAEHSEVDKNALPSSPGEPSVSNVNWADLGKKIHREKRQTPLWIVGIVILVIILGVTGYFLNEHGFFDFSNTQQEEITTPESQPMSDAFSLELDEPEQQQPSVVDESQEVIQLSDTLYISVYAAFDNLSPVRVWSDLKPRLDPYWLEQGTAMNFEFRDSVQVRGTYNNMLLFMNGHIIENFVQTNYNEETDVVEFSRSYFTSDPVWSETTEIEPPEGVSDPDTVISRPVF